MRLRQWHQLTERPRDSKLLAFQPSAALGRLAAHNLQYALVFVGREPMRGDEIIVDMWFLHSLTSPDHFCLRTSYCTGGLGGRGVLGAVRLDTAVCQTFRESLVPISRREIARLQTRWRKKKAEHKARPKSNREVGNTWCLPVTLN